MSLEKVIKQWFEGYSDDKLESLLEKLDDLGITSEGDLQLLEEEDLRDHGFGKIEMRKLMLLKSECKDNLKSVLRKIFVESPEKIEDRLRLLNEMGAYDEGHLTLVWDKIKISTEFNDIDKEKIKDYLKIESNDLKSVLKQIFKGESDEKKIEKSLNILNEMGAYDESHLILVWEKIKISTEFNDIDKEKIKDYLKIESKNELKSVLQEKIFVGESMAKIEKCLGILNGMGAYDGPHLSLLSEKIEMSSEFDDVDKKKLMLYINPEAEPDPSISLNCAFQRIFKGEDAAKINKYLNIFKELGIQWENQLPLGMVELDNHPDILEIDKNKISQYVKRNYNEDFKEFREIKKEEREMIKLEHELKYKMKTTQMGIFDKALEGMKQERLQITNECSRLRKEIADYQKYHPMYNYFVGTDTKIKNLEQSLKRNENLKTKLDKEIDAHIKDLNAITDQ